MPHINKGPQTHHLDRRAHQIIAQIEGGSSNDLIDTPTLAAWLGVSRQWLEIGRVQGYGPPFIRLGPRSIRYRRGAVLGFLQLRIYARTADYPTSKPYAAAQRSKSASGSKARSRRGLKAREKEDHA